MKQEEISQLTDDLVKRSPQNWNFKPVGFGDGNKSFYYIDKITGQVVAIKAGQHTSPSALLSLESNVEWWEFAFQNEKGGCDWQGAAAALMKMCKGRGKFDPAMLRGRGAWYDAGKALLHLGDRILCDGVSHPVSDYPSRYIYTRDNPMESIIGTEPATPADSVKVMEIVTRLNWASQTQAMMATGWLVLAPICGALRWRPHIWLTAQRGAGKSWMQHHIAEPLLGSSALLVQGSTTEAGLRQRLKHDARPVVFDEAEAETQAGIKRMQSVIELARQASSEGGAEIVKGTVDGSGMSFRIRSMFMLGSVNVSLTQAADESRFCVVQLMQPKKNPEEAERFRLFEAHVDGTLTKEFCASVRARTYTLIPVIRENAQILSQAVAEVLGSQRIGDQVGTLLAGYMSLLSSNVLTIEEARGICSRLDFADARDQEQVSDEEQCIQRLMQSQVQFESDGRPCRRTIGEVMAQACGKTVGGVFTSRADANLVLQRYGLSVDGQSLLVSNTHAEIQKALKDTPWAAGWRRILSRLPGAEPSSSPVRFAGSQTRATRIPISSVI